MICSNCHFRSMVMGRVMRSGHGQVSQHGVRASAALRVAPTEVSERWKYVHCIADNCALKKAAMPDNAYVGATRRAGGPCVRPCPAVKSIASQELFIM